MAPKRSDPKAVVEAIFFPGVWAETCSMTIWSASMFGLPGFHTRIGGMKPLDGAFSSRLAYWRDVTQAFALELYLKTLACLDHGTHLSATHNLRVLFDDLSNPTKTAMRVHADAFLQRHPSPKIQDEARVRKCPEFDAALDASADAFVLVRYLHQPHARDSTNWSKDWFGFHLMQSARNVVIGRKPDWGRQTAHLLPSD